MSLRRDFGERGLNYLEHLEPLRDFYLAPFHSAVSRAANGRANTNRSRESPWGRVSRAEEDLTTNKRVEVVCLPKVNSSLIPECFAALVQGFSPTLIKSGLCRKIQLLSVPRKITCSHGVPLEIRKLHFATVALPCNAAHSDSSRTPFEIPSQGNRSTHNVGRTKINLPVPRKKEEK